MEFARKLRRAGAPLELPSTPPPPPPPPPPPAGFGPNAPVGIEAPWPIFTGDTMPALTGSGGMVLNAYGMGTYYSDAMMLSLVADAASSSGQALRCTYPGISDPALGTAFPPPDFGGGAPARYMLRGGVRDQQWRTLYLRARRRHGVGVSAWGTSVSATIHDTGTAGVGSSITGIVDGTKAWTPGEHVGRYMRHGATGRGIRIIANTATTLTPEAGKRFNYNPTGEAYGIFTVQSVADGWNAGMKGLCFPRIAARLQGNQTTPGGGAGYGTPWSHDAVGPVGDNGIILGWRNFDDTQGAQGLDHRYQLQWNRTWDSPWTEDGMGLPAWNLSGDYSTFPPAPASKLVYTPGDVADEEYLLVLNTPGVADGIFRHWLNGTLVRESTTVRYVPPYVDAMGAGVTVTLGGSARRVALAVSEPRWDYLWHDPTYGGGLRVPLTTFHVDLLDAAIGGLR